MNKSGNPKRASRSAARQHAETTTQDPIEDAATPQAPLTDEYPGQPILEPEDEAPESIEALEGNMFDPHTQSPEVHDPIHADHDAEEQPEVGASMHDDAAWDTPWEQPNALQAPKARPGMAQRWVRFDINGHFDRGNWAKKYREGWRPRDPGSLPPSERKFFATDKHPQLGDVIFAEGLVLCEMPAKRVEARREYYRRKTEAQTRSIKQRDQEFNEQVAQPHTGFGRVHREESVRTTSGARMPRVASD